MKSLFLSLIMVLGCSLAKAETIDLSPTSCTRTYICYNVQNDANPSVGIDYIDYSSTWARLTLSMDGTIYDSGVGSTPSSLQNVPLYSPAGVVVYATLTFSVIHKPCVRSGRVTVCPVIVTLTSGTVEK